MDSEKKRAESIFLMELRSGIPFAFLFFGKLAAIATGFTVFIKKWVLAGTGAGKFTIFLRPYFQSNTQEGKGQKTNSQQEELHISRLCKDIK